MRSILIPTDLSPASYQALPFARDLSEKGNTRFSMIHVYKNDCINLFPSYRDQAVSVMKNLLVNYRLTDLPHRCYIREGDVSDCVAKAAGEQPESFVIMGRNVVPDDGPKEGTAFKIVKKAPCPVLFIPQGRLQSPVFEILYVINIEQGANETLKSVLRFSGELNAHLTYLHVMPLNATATYRKGFSEDILRSGNQDLSCSFIRANDIYAGIRLYLRNKQADIIAIDTYSDSGFFKKFRRSLVVQLLTQSDFPVLFYNSKRNHGRVWSFHKEEHKNENTTVS